MTRKREDMVSDLVDSYTTRELKALVKMLGASDPWDMYPIDLVASAIKAELFEPAARTQMHEPREGDGGDYDDIDCHPDYDAKTDSIKEKTDV